jgi:hypothetical protein
MSKNKIIFTNTLNVPKEYAPKPASNFVPDWYKTMDSHIGKVKRPSGSGTSNATIKRCMPVFDAITSGYIILSAADVFVSQRKDGNGNKHPYFEWTQYGLIEFHPYTQAPEHPQRNNHESYPKWVNPWGVKTPKGYSVLFTQPMHRESVFTILSGVVDTDTYTAPVNFPFVLNDLEFEGLIPAGTPIAQVIPFKRESWQLEYGSQENFIEQQQVTNLLSTKFFERYKTLFRQPKEYR